MKNLIKLTLASLLFIGVLSCGSSVDDPDIVDPTEPAKENTENKDFVTGGDLSWLTEMEDNGVKFYSRETMSDKDCMAIFKELGMKAIRFRVWVNPKTKYNDAADVLYKATRAQEQGFKIMIDFHYSDTWADPGNQEKPKAWANYSVSELCTAISNHTTTVLQSLKDKNVQVAWVQVGNETADGMLFPDGQISKGNAKNFASFINAGYDAAKKVYPDAKVVVHVDQGDVYSRAQYVFDALKTNGGKWDIIGLSLYPDYTPYKAKLTTCATNVEKLYTAYGTPSIICEVGMSRTAVTQCKEFLSNLADRMKKLSDKKCGGIFYWEPEDYKGWNGGYDKGAFTNDGFPNDALVTFYKK